MVTAGFAATVAPLGTALTEDQLALLWKMADEPILCFDGDRAGQTRGLSRRRSGAAASQARQEPAIRAAAAKGRTPTISLRSAGARRDRGGDRRGAAARRRCCGRARPRAAVVRHAGAARGAGSAHQRADQRRSATKSVRRYYRQDFAERLRAVLRAGRRRAPARGLSAARGNSARAAARRGGQLARAARRPTGSRAARGARARPAAGRHALLVASQQLASSPIMRGQRSAVPRREALILQAALNHPWLLHDHLEEVAALEFAPSGRRAAASAR